MALSNEVGFMRSSHLVYLKLGALKVQKLAVFGGEAPPNCDRKKMVLEPANSTGVYARSIMIYHVSTYSENGGLFELIYEYGSIPINTIFSGMNIHKSQLFWGSLGTRVLTHPHIVFSAVMICDRSN